MMKKSFVSFVLILVALGILVVGYQQYIAPEVRPDHNQETMETPYVSVNAKSKTFRALVADSEAERAQGLSGRAGLANDELLLFVFEVPGRHGFWMKDMLFSIDIFWLDETGTIVHVEESVTPDTFPTSFAPSSDAWYVIEANAGFAQTHQLQVGERFELPAPYGGERQE